MRSHQVESRWQLRVEVALRQHIPGALQKDIERSVDVPRDSATARALRNEPRPTKGFFENGSVASWWFPFVDDDSYRNAIMMEQAVPLGRFGALTFLFPEAGHF